MAGKVEQEYQACVADGIISADAAQVAILPEFDRIRDALETASAPRGLRGLLAKRPEATRGLYLWGGVGRGKSMLMDLFVSTVDVPKRRVHFHAFMQEIHAEMHEARKGDVKDALQPVAAKVAREVRLLAFDEMQISDITDAMIVGRLFEMLFSAGVVVVTTSNRPPDDLYRDGLNRGLFLPFIDLLKKKMVVRELASETDFRRGRLAEAQAYFSPANAHARTEIDLLWSRLTDGHEEPLVLKVQGRDVVLPRYHNGVARAAFWEICGKPLGPADYLALAEAVRVLVLEEVPCLGRYNFNEARRFVTLIDALYEAKVRLIMSAADIPERLYLEGEGTFEFERTASRLHEMQSIEWGKDH
jgi:cell division protein ZapE